MPVPGNTCKRLRRVVGVSVLVTTSLFDTSEQGATNQLDVSYDQVACCDRATITRRHSQFVVALACC